MNSQTQDCKTLVPTIKKSSMKFSMPEMMVFDETEKLVSLS